MDHNMIQLTGTRNKKIQNTKEMKMRKPVKMLPNKKKKAFPYAHMVNESQPQPPNFYPDPGNMWAPSWPEPNMQQEPWSHPQAIQAWNPNSTFNSAPTGGFEGSFHPYNVEQPLPNQDNNMITSECWSQPTLTPGPSQPTFNPGAPQPTFNPGAPQPTFIPGAPQPTFIPGASQPTFIPGAPQPTFIPGPPQPTFIPGPLKQGKKKKQPKQQPKKKKTAELSFEEKQKRQAELRSIEEKYRQVVMIHKVVSQNPAPAPVPKKPNKPVPKKQTVPAPKTPAVVVPKKPTLVPVKPIATVTPSKQAVPTVQQINQIVTDKTATPPGRSLQPGPFQTIRTRKRHRSKKNKNQGHQAQPSAYSAGAASTGQYQAPHQDEPEDLTDDLAPNVTGGQPGAQTVTAENKLNFKFQRTGQKNPDWSEYQNKFRRVGGDSPEPAADVKREPADSVDAESNTSKPQTTSLTAPQQTLTTTGTPQKTGFKPGSQASTPQKSAALTPKVEPVQKPAVKMQSQTHTRGQHISQQKGMPQPFYYVHEATAYYPKGIPRSFLQQAAQVPQLNPEVDYPTQPSPHIDLPSWVLASQGMQQPQSANMANPPMFPPAFSQQESTDRPYSPTDLYSEIPREEDPHEGSGSPELPQSGQKRQSAFSRLGPLAQPKKPKLTINLMLNKEQAVREVVDEADESFRYIPVHLRRDILESADETVKKYLPFWPWKKNLQLRKTVSARHSKSAMMLEQEQMESGYEKNNVFIQVSVKGYPKTWHKEDVLDAILDCVKGKHFIPCFVEFTPQECKFLVIRCRDALLAIHRVGFYVRAGDVELTVSISLTDTGLNQIDLIPRLVLRKRLIGVYDGENTLDLSEFFTEKDVSHFMYFPLNRPTNQAELVQLQSAVAWEYLTDLNLSHNRLTTLSGFDLCKTTPRLKRLDLSHNHFDRLTALLPLRDLPLRALRLEGNPLCHDYIDSAHYVKVARMMFSEIRELDGVRITLKGDLPPMKRNYCPEAAVPIVEKFLETFFPLLEAYDDRAAIQDMYDKDAVLTITYKHKIRYGAAYRYFRSLFSRARSLEEGELEEVAGGAAITALLLKWPAVQHDRYAMTVDVLHHTDSTTILRIGGILKLTAESLAEDEHLLTFTRTVVLHTRNGAEYKIHNEMLYWDVPGEEVTRNAFNITTVRPKQLSLKLESPPDEDLKSNLVDIFVKLADIDKKRGARCLELKNWDLRTALEYYISLLKNDNLSALSPPKQSTPVPQAS